MLTSGPLPPNAAELLGSSRMRELTAQLLERADLVIFDTPPVTALSDAAILGSQVGRRADGRRCGRDPARGGPAGVMALQRVNARVVGAAAQPDADAQGNGYYYYYYYHYGDYGAENNGSGANGSGGSKRRSRQRRRPANAPVIRPGDSS